MFIHYIEQLHCTLYHNNQSSLDENVVQGEDLKEEWNDDLRGCYSSFRNRWVIQQGMSLDSRAILLIIAFKLIFYSLNYKGNKTTDK